MGIQQHKKFKILLLGDSCTDEYRFGVVDRISPEAPVPVFNFKYQQLKPGMAANVRDNFNALGCEVISFLGPESVKTRLIDIRSHQQILRIDHDAHVSMPLDGKYLNFKGIDAVVISDYDKGYVTKTLIKNIEDSYNGPIFLDTKKKNIDIFSKCIIKVNEQEFETLECTHPNVVITLGIRGAKWKDKVYPSAKEVQVSDVCGAGDTFFASLVYFYLNEGSIEKAIPFANRAGAITVQHLGTYTPTLKEIYEA